MRFAIYGAGSLGTILGAFITKNGGQIDLINRNKAHVEALRANGATVIGQLNFNQKVTALTVDEMSGVYDVIFLMTKQQQNAEVVSFLKDYLADDGVIVTLQNGIPDLVVGEIVGEERTIGGTVGWGATMKEPGVCELTSPPDLLTFSIGTLSGKPNPKMQIVKETLELMGPVTLHENFLGSRWSKLLINSALSGMGTVIGGTFGDAVADKQCRKAVQALIKECIDVCKTGNIKIEPFQGMDIAKIFYYSNPVKKALAYCIIPIAVKKHAAIRPSMLQDIEKGKKCEVDAINGVICKFGRKYGCPTPMNDTVVEVVHKIESGELKACPDNLKYFGKL